MKVLSKLSKHFMIMEVSATVLAVVLQTEDFGLFGNRDNGGLRITCGEYILEQGLNKNVSEDFCQLIYTHLEGSARDAIRSRCHMCVHSF